MVVAALLGADEFGFSTAPLIVLGCTMMRKCHLNTCPVGIATQDPVLRKKFQGQPEHVINYLFLLAEDIRRHMASLGVTRFQQLVGRTDLLRVRDPAAGGPGKARLLDFSAVLRNALDMRPGVNIVGGSLKQDFGLETHLDRRLIALSADVLNGSSPRVEFSVDVDNSCRAVGSTLSYYIAKKHGDAGLPSNSINIAMKGSAGQSFCAFLARGVHVTLEGDANDYVAKGLSGGEVVIYPPKASTFESERNIIVGNACLYGATSGRVFLRGVAAERFCVRNSGATAVVEGVGDHGCEYMTGGVVLILGDVFSLSFRSPLPHFQFCFAGSTGRNFAAGMSGGIAYVLDVRGTFASLCNAATVELLPLEKEKDLAVVRSLLAEFYEKTGSRVAKELLDGWPASKGRFVKVFPFEYQKALEQQETERQKNSHVKEARPESNGLTRHAQNGVTSATKNGQCNDEVDRREKHANGHSNGHPIADIEDAVVDESASEKKLDKIRGFMKYGRETHFYRQPEKRADDWEEIYNFNHVRRGLKTQAARCMECGVPFCQSSYGCPLGNVIPKWNDLVFKNKWKEALDMLLQTNNFPEFTGRVCPAPCENACVLGINSPSVAIKSIECAIIDHAFEQGWMTPKPPAARTGKTVAVVGSGPAGLACAHQLNKVRLGCRRVNHTR